MRYLFETIFDGSCKGIEVLFIYIGLFSIYILGKSIPLTERKISKRKAYIYAFGVAVLIGLLSNEFTIIDRPLHNFFKYFTISIFLIIPGTAQGIIEPKKEATRPTPSAAARDDQSDQHNTCR